MQSCRTYRSSFAGLATKSAQPLCSPPASLVKCRRHQLKTDSAQLQLEAKALLGHDTHAQQTKPSVMSLLMWLQTISGKTSEPTGVQVFRQRKIPEH